VKETISLAVMGGLAWTAEPTLPAYSALGLSPEQQQRIDEILGATMQRFAALRDQNPNDDAHFAKAVRSTKAQADSEIATVLGPQKFKAWQAYHRERVKKTKQKLLDGTFFEDARR
jgi:hypothetical protein